MVFAKMLFETDDIEPVNYSIYLKWFDTFAADFPVNKIIYVRASPEICHLRITKRSRDGENNISLDYLDNCNKYHEDMLDKTKDYCVCNDQLILDGNLDIYQDPEQNNKWIKYTIAEFLDL